MTDGLNIISLFSGLGGLDLGLKAAGHQIIIQIENDPYCIETLTKNWNQTPIIPEDITKVSGSEIISEGNINIKEIDLIVGGPSCQPFSRSNEGKRRGIKDGRGLMIFEFARIIEELRPKAFIMENVAGLISSNRGEDFKKLVEIFTLKLRYDIKYKILNAADYGVAQKRKRLFIIGFREREDFTFPLPTHGNNKRPYVGVNKVIGDLDDGIIFDSSESIGGKYGHLINEIPPGKNYLHFTEEAGHPNPIFKNRSRFWPFLLKLDPEQPSTTIQAQPWNSVGPFHWNNRRLTLAEIKRIQGISDDYYISGNNMNNQNIYNSPAWMQVGNAVPPKLGEVIGQCVAKQI